MNRILLFWCSAVVAGLTLAHAETVNVALDARPAANGSIYIGWPMSIIVNGITSDIIHGGVQLPAGFAYTLDLGKPRSIRSLQIWPRQDGIAPERLSNFRVSLHEDDGAGEIGAELWGQDLFTDGTNPGTSVVVVTVPTPVNARWVKVMCLSDPVPDYSLQMSELEVFADVPETEVNRALGSFVTANRPLYATLSAAYLVDGNRYNVVHAAQSVDPGFAYEINLGASVDFTSIVVLARQDGIAPERLSNYRVSIHPDQGGQPGEPVWHADLHTDWSNPGADWGSQDVLTADLDPAGQFKGQWIRILSLDDPVPAYALQIAEVQAFGIPAQEVKLLITTHPVDVSANTGQSLSFNVAAKVINGDAAQIAYQWQHQGTNLVGATNATLTIEHVRIQDAGVYQCVVSYPGVPSLISASATLEVRVNYAYNAMAWANQPLWGGWDIARIVDGDRNTIVHGDAALVAGFAYTINLGLTIKMSHIEIYPRQDGIVPERLTNFRVSVHKDNAGAMGDVVWQTDLFTDWSNPGSGPGIVVRLTADLDPNGKFEGQWIKIESLDDPPSPYALQMNEVEVYGEPVISSPFIAINRQPADFTTVPGRTATFAIDASLYNGDPALLAYQWQRNGIDIVGATSARYVTPVLSEADANAKFRCVLSYPGLAPVLSDEATLLFDYNYARGATAFANQPTYPGLSPAGLTDGNFSVSGLVHGSSGLKPGFAYTINLGLVVTVSNIFIYPRQDGVAPERLSNYRVSVHPDLGGQPGEPVWQADLHTDGSNPGASPGSCDVLGPELDPNGKFEGQWIRILSLDDPVPDYALQISEVVVIGRLASKPAITIKREANSVVLTWSGGTLESAPEVTGPWTVVQNATSPLSLTLDEPRRFYRVR